MFRASFLVAVLAAAVAAPQTSRADVVTEWNVVAVNAAVGASSLAESRALAISHAAMFDAVNAIERRYQPYHADVKAPAGTSLDAAGAVAMHGVLVWLFPERKAMLDGALATTLGRVAEGPGREARLNLGRQVAQNYVSVRAKDGASASASHLPASGAGQWQPTPPAHAPMAAPHWADIIPFTVKSFGDLDVKGPPAMSSAAYAHDLEEVRRLGARHSTERSADQTAAAIFWVINTAVPWQAAARAAAQQRGTGVVDNARAFALINLAGADTYIASWGMKRKANHWRPITAIHNAAANADPAWEPLLNTPPHPEYPSGYCIYSGAAAHAIQQLYKVEEVSFSATFGGPNGVTRSWKSITQAEKEVEGARVWGGIHFRTADEHGTQLGHTIASRAIASLMKPNL
jgi:hypothetical protein